MVKIFYALLLSVCLSGCVTCRQQLESGKKNINPYAQPNYRVTILSPHTDEVLYTQYAFDFCEDKESYTFVTYVNGAEQYYTCRKDLCRIYEITDKTVSP